MCVDLLLIVEVDCLITDQNRMRCKFHNTVWFYFHKMKRVFDAYESSSFASLEHKEKFRCSYCAELIEEKHKAPKKRQSDES